jgi:hypothetical protein
MCINYKLFISQFSWSKNILLPKAKTSENYFVELFHMVMFDTYERNLFCPQRRDPSFFKKEESAGTIHCNSSAPQNSTVTDARRSIESLIGKNAQPRILILLYSAWARHRRKTETPGRDGTAQALDRRRSFCDQPTPPGRPAAALLAYFLARQPPAPRGPIRPAGHNNSLFCSARRPSSERGRPPPPGSPPSAAHYTCRAPRLLPAPHRATQSFTHRGRSAGRAAVPAGPQRPVRVRCRLLHGWQPRTEARSWHRLREAGRVLSPA